MNTAININELELNENLIIFFKIEEVEYEFSTKILRRENGSTFLDIIKIDGKILNFKTNKINVKIILKKEKETPIVFNNCKLIIVKTKSGISYYYIAAADEGIPLNRRENYRVSVAKLCDIQLGDHSCCINTYMKDISISGFSFVFDKIIDDYKNKKIKLTFNDNDYNYHIVLSGNIIRHEQLKNGRHVYGCKYEKDCFQLCKYISLKQREELLKNKY